MTVSLSCEDTGNNHVVEHGFPEVGAGEESWGKKAAPRAMTKLADLAACVIRQALCGRQDPRRLHVPGAVTLIRPRIGRWVTPASESRPVHNGWLQRPGQRG